MCTTGLGRTVQVIQPSGSGTTTYLYEGASTTVTSPASKWKKFQKDAFGNLVTVTEPRPGGGTYITTYLYDVLNRLTDVSMTRDGTTQARAFRYNAQQRLEAVTTPESGTTTYNYNPDGTLLRKTDAKGQKVEYAYDGLNRLVGINRFPVGALQPDACQGVTLLYDTNYIPGIRNPNPQGHVTEAVSGRFTARPARLSRCSTTPRAGWCRSNA